ncbi:hypothetical protein [Gordonia sputi]
MATAVASTFAPERRFSTRVKLGVAAASIATAAAFTPAVVHSAPLADAAPVQVAMITKGVPYVVSAASAQRAAAPSAVARSLSDCLPNQLGCYLIEGLRTAGSQFRQGPAYWAKGVATLVGTTTYVAVTRTGQIFKSVGLTRIGQIFTFIADAIANITKVGPYHS